MGNAPFWMTTNYDLQGYSQIASLCHWNVLYNCEGQHLTTHLQIFRYYWL